MENLEVRLKCVELLIDAYKNNKGQFVTVDDIIYQADRLTDFIRGVDYAEEETLGSGLKQIPLTPKGTQVNLAIEKLERLINSVRDSLTNRCS